MYVTLYFFNGGTRKFWLHALSMLYHYWTVLHLAVERTPAIGDHAVVDTCHKSKVLQKKWIFYLLGKTLYLQSLEPIWAPRPQLQWMWTANSSQQPPALKVTLDDRSHLAREATTLWPLPTTMDLPMTPASLVVKRTFVCLEGTKVSGTGQGQSSPCSTLCFPCLILLSLLSDNFRSFLLFVWFGVLSFLLFFLFFFF